VELNGNYLMDSGVKPLEVFTLSEKDRVLVVVPIDHKRCIKYTLIQLFDQSVQSVDSIKSV